MLTFKSSPHTPMAWPEDGQSRWSRYIGKTKQPENRETAPKVPS